MGNEPYDDGFVTAALDHIVASIRTNADGDYAGQAFRNAHEKLRLIRQRAGIDPQAAFLERLLPMLAGLQRLPKGLVPELILFFGWPASKSELALAASIDPGVRELLERHARENPSGDGSYLQSRYHLFLRKHPLLLALLAMAGAFGVAIAMLFLRLFTHAIGSSGPGYH